MRREPAVAGTFYEATEEELRESIDACYLGPYGPGELPIAAPIVTRNIVGLVCPHAGYTFSGYAAASAYFQLAEDGMPDTAVIIGPNHRGIGARAAIMTEGTWSTPLGTVEVDSETASEILNYSGEGRCFDSAQHGAQSFDSAHPSTNAQGGGQGGGRPLLIDDPKAHIREHSIEVQLPFLQALGGSTKIVPIVLSILAWEDALLYAEYIGRGIAKAIEGKNAVVIASTDFTHYEPKSSAEVKDNDAIEAISALDHHRLLDVVVRKNISMCGAAPTAAAIVACKELGATSGRLLAYYTSGDILGDTSQVVGYGALELIREGAGC